MIYTDEAINGALVLLNSMEIKGIENAKRVVMIDQILRNPMEDKNNGSKDKKVQ